MKKIVFLSLLCITTFYGQNEKNKYFKLYKGGKNYPSPIIYIKAEEDKYSVKKLDSGDLIFNFKNKIFRYSLKKHVCKPISQAEYDKIEFTNFNELLKIEHDEFLKRSKEVEIEKGFKPLAPVKHHILDIYIVVSTRGNSRNLYQVNWESSNF